MGRCTRPCMASLARCVSALISRSARPAVTTNCRVVAPSSATARRVAVANTVEVHPSKHCSSSARSSKAVPATDQRADLNQRFEVWCGCATRPQPGEQACRERMGGLSGRKSLRLLLPPVEARMRHGMIQFGARAGDDFALQRKQRSDAVAQRCIVIQPDEMTRAARTRWIDWRHGGSVSVGGSVGLRASLSTSTASASVLLSPTPRSAKRRACGITLRSSEPTALL